MAQEEKLTTITRPANADLSTKQYLFVEMDTSGNVGACNSAGELAIGVLQNDPDASGRAATVAIGGVSKVVLGGTVAINAKVATTAAGKADTAASGNHVMGICVKGGVLNDIGEVLLGVHPPVLA